MCGCSRQSTVPEGEPGTTDYHLYFFNANGDRISPWHDIPFQPDDAAADVFNFVCEIPKGCVTVRVPALCLLPCPDRVRLPVDTL